MSAGNGSPKEWNFPEYGTEKEQELLYPIKNGNENICVTMGKEQNGADNTMKFNTAQDCKDSENNLMPPDGGWGWVVLLGGVFSMVLATLPLIGYGILFVPMWKRSNATSAMISWIFNTQVFITNIVNVSVGPLCEEFGWRRVAFIGGVISGLSFILSAFAPSPEFLFFSFSTLGGIGGSFGISANIFVVSKYFLKKRGFALGILTLGGCAGGFIIPLLSNFLLEMYGFKGACLILGGITLNQCVSATLYEPIERHLIYNSNVIHENDYNKTDIANKVEMIVDDDDQIDITIMHRNSVRNKFSRRLSEASQYSSGLTEQSAIPFPTSIQSENKVLKSNSHSSCLVATYIIIRISKSMMKCLCSLRSLQVIFIAVSAGCVAIGYLSFQMWVSFVVRDAGYTLELSAWCLSVASISNTIARISISAVADCQRFNVRIAYVTGILLIAISVSVFPLRSEYAYLLFWAVVWGFGIGICMSLYSTVMICTVGDELFPTVYGVSSLCIALTFIIIGPILGVIRDMTSNYYCIMWIISAYTLLGALLWLLMPVASKLDIKRDRKKIDIG